VTIQDIYTNTRPLWHPPGARGIYGGAVIAQCLAAAQRTVPSHFTVHSMHCYFVLAGDSTTPIIYHVEHVREGKSFATRTVQARQRGKPIFTTTMSFAREGSGGAKQVAHGTPLPAGIRPPGDDEEGDASFGPDRGTPFESRRIEISHKEGAPHVKRCRQWIRAKGKISDAGGHEAHLSALAYMSDSYFIGTVGRVHNLWRFGAANDAHNKLLKDNPKLAEQIRKVKVFEGFADDLDNKAGRPEVGMMVSLDHTIYFHEPRSLKADEWLFTEMESPWSGDGRGLVMQKIWSSDGTLVATCIQEVCISSRTPESNS
jgi:acyl-CoA thioesterase